MSYIKCKTYIILHQLGKLLVDYLSTYRSVKCYNPCLGGRRADNERVASLSARRPLTYVCVDVCVSECVHVMGRCYGSLLAGSVYHLTV